MVVDLPLSLKHIDRVLNCTSIEEVWALHTEKMKEYGFDRLLYCGSRFGTHDLFGDIQDALILTNRDPIYIQEYVYSGLFRYTSVASWAKRTAGVYSWRNIENWSNGRKFSVEEAGAREVNVKWGILNGYSICFDSVDRRSKSIIGLCAREELTQNDVDTLWEEKADEIIIFNNLLNLKVSNLPHTGQHRPLTTRQREVLEWTADGKTVKDIALIMDLSCGSVEKHLRRSREALGVETTTHAVQKASILNQLFLI